MNSRDLAYRKSAAQGASGFGLLIALYDTLAGDLRRAAAAQRSGNIEARTNELKHALVVVGCLENWIDADSGELAKQLIAFYSDLRRKMIEAQAKQSAEMMDEQMASVLGMREIWQKLDLKVEDGGPEILPPARMPSYGGFAAMQMEGRQFSWSA
ncbi:MAG: flagellar export chaperone FliS [Terracidiphilus sp.]